LTTPSNNDIEVFSYQDKLKRRQGVEGKKKKLKRRQEDEGKQEDQEKRAKSGG
jgi:hypothetical protein